MYTSLTESSLSGRDKEASEEPEADDECPENVDDVEQVTDNESALDALVFFEFFFQRLARNKSRCVNIGLGVRREEGDGSEGADRDGPHQGPS